MIRYLVLVLVLAIALVIGAGQATADSVRCWPNACALPSDVAGRISYRIRMSHILEARLSNAAPGSVQAQSLITGWLQLQRDTDRDLLDALVGPR